MAIQNLAVVLLVLVGILTIPAQSTFGVPVFTQSDSQSLDSSHNDRTDDSDDSSPPAGPACFLGDVNQDGEVDLLDVIPFINLIFNAGYLCEADVNEDGVVNFGDAQPLIAIMTGG